MDVSCPQCDTLYELDDQQARRAALTLKCSQCDHLFRLELGSEVRDESDRRWMARRLDAGDILYFAGFDTLHQWIMEGEIGAEDEISRTGNSWTKLADIGEFSPIFQVVASIADLSSGQAGDEMPPFERQDEGGPKRSSDTEPSYRPAPSTGDSSPREHPRPSTDSDATERPLPRENRRGQPTPMHRPGADGDEPSHPQQHTDEFQAANRRSRTGTEPQFKANNSESADGADRIPASEARQRSNRSTPPPRKRISSHGASAQSSPPKPESTPASPDVQLSDSRFEGASSSDTAQNEAEPTLGELEYGPVSDPTLEEAYASPRRWPWVVAVVVVLGAGMGVWQWPLIADSLGLVGDDSAVEKPVVVPSEQGLELATEEVDQVLERGVEAGRQQLTLMATEKAVAVGDGAVQEAAKAAESAASAAVPRQPSSPAELVRAGRRSYERGNIEQATRRFQAALEQSPDHAEAVVGLGWAHLSRGAIDDAIDLFREAMQIDPSMGEGLIGIGRAERNRGQQEAALQAYEDYLSRFPNGSHASIAQYQSDQLRQQIGD